MLFFGLFFVYFIFYKVLRYVDYLVNSTGDSYYENNCPANLEHMIDISLLSRTGT